MEKDLYLKDKYPIEIDDLKFNGKQMIIPSYWAGVMSEYIKNIDPSKDFDTEADRQDFKNFRDFLWKIEDRLHGNFL